MSMLSAQVDELRKLAGDGSMEWVAGPIRTSVLREAADTIWELRDDLQRANAENAKLRKLVQKLYANLRNRETILELMRMPPSEAAKDEVIAIIDKCSELGIEVE